MVVQTPEMKLWNFGYLEFQLKTTNVEKNGGNDLVRTIARNRAIGKQLREQIAERSLYICELHYREDQINCCQVVILTKCFIFNSVIITIATTIHKISREKFSFIFSAIFC